MPKLVDKGDYYQVQSTGLEQFAAAVEGIGASVLAVAQGLQKKRDKDKKDQEDAQELLLKVKDIGLQDPKYVQDNLINDPIMGAALLRIAKAAEGDHKYSMAQSLKDFKAGVRAGSIIPSDLQKSKMAEQAAKTGKAQNEEVKSNLEVGTLQAQAKLRESTNPAERIAGTFGKPPSTDELKAMLVPDQIVKAVRASVPGNLEYMQAESSKFFTEQVAKLNPQTPQEIAAIKQMGDYAAGLADTPPKGMPKSLERLNTELDARRVANLEAGTRLEQSRFNLQRATQVYELGSKLTQRMLNSGVKGDGYALAAGIVYKGEIPTGLPPDLVQMAQDDKIKSDALISQENLARLRASSPTIDFYMKMASQRHDLKDDAGAKQFSDMALAEFKKKFNIQDPEQAPEWWKMAAASMLGPFAYPTQALMQMGPKGREAAGTAAMETLGAIPGAVSQATDVLRQGLDASGGNPQKPETMSRQPNAPTFSGSRVESTPVAQPTATGLSPEQTSAIDNELSTLQQIATAGQFNPQIRDYAKKRLEIIKAIKNGQLPFNALMGMNQ